MAAVIDAEQAQWILGGAPSITVASCNEARLPSLGQGIGCRIDKKRRRLTVFMVEPRNAAVVADLRAGRAIAVVFTHGASLRSLQLKASGAREVAIEPGDSDRIGAYIGALTLDWMNQPGITEAFVHTLVARGPGAILAFEFEPYVAFDQTPGPQAGTPLPAVP